VDNDNRSINISVMKDIPMAGKGAASDIQQKETGGN